MSMPSHPSLSAEERELARLLGRLDGARQPSVAVDAAILALARQSVAAQAVARSTPPRLRRWPAVMGLAASLMLAVGIAWQLRPTQDMDYASEPPAAASADAAGAPEQAASGPWVDDMAADAATPAATPDAFPSAEPTVPAPIIPASSRNGAAVAIDAEPERRQRASVASEAAPQVAMQPDMADMAAPIAAPVPPPPPAAMAEATAPVEAATNAAAPAAARNERTLDQIVVTGSRVPEPPPESSARTTAAQAPAGSPAADRDYDTAGFSTEAIDQQPPANADAPLVQKAWLNRIRALLARGEITAAQHSLGEFHRRYPQYPLPDDLQRLVPPPAPTP